LKLGQTRSSLISNELILVVEDEWIVRLFACDLLEQAGFKVLEAGGADEALEALEAHPEVRGLFTDVNMPGSMDGLALARHVQAHNPQIVTLVVSGRGPPEPGELPANASFMAKPYEAQEMVSRLRRMTA